MFLRQNARLLNFLQDNFYVYNKCEGRGFMTNKNCHKNRGAAEVFMSSFYLS